MTLTITDLAVKQFSSIIEGQAPEGQLLRIVAGEGGGCGCSGGGFGMGFDSERANDTVMEIFGLRIALDPTTAPQLEGASIDYVEEAMEQGFVIEAPNAATGGGCSCGAQ